MLTQIHKDAIKALATRDKIVLLQTLSTGAGRPPSVKAANAQAIMSIMASLNIPYQHMGKPHETDVPKAAEIVAAAIGRVVEITLEPVNLMAPTVSEADRLIQEFKDNSATPENIINGVDVRLDNAQKPHQSDSNPIGTRVASKNNSSRFNDDCDLAWHQRTTMRYMAEWGAAQEVEKNKKAWHGQLGGVSYKLWPGEIAFEGFVLLAKGKRYVSYHCYPIKDTGLSLAG